MAPLLVLLLLLAAGAAPVRAQINTDGPVKMTPDLALAIPLVQVKHDVTVKFPVLINGTTVVKPGMILRNIYIPPTQEDSENLEIAHKGNMDDSYARGSDSQDTDSEPRMPPEIAHALETQRRIVWDVPINFQLALAQLPTESIHLIYSRSGDNRHLDDQRFNFFDGMFLGSPAGGVSVLGVATGSKSDHAGVKAGDRILAVGGTAVPADLAAFPPLYFHARDEAEGEHAASFPMQVQSTGETGSHTVNIATPPSIKSMLNEGL